MFKTPRNCYSFIDALFSNSSDVIYFTSGLIYTLNEQCFWIFHFLYLVKYFLTAFCQGAQLRAPQACSSEIKIQESFVLFQCTFTLVSFHRSLTKTYQSKRWLLLFSWNVQYKFWNKQKCLGCFVFYFPYLCVLIGEHDKN